MDIFDDYFDLDDSGIGRPSLQREFHRLSLISIDSSSSEDEFDDMAQDPAGQAAAAAAVAAAAAGNAGNGNNPKGGEINTLDKYDGTEGNPGLTFCAAVDRAMIMFGWTQGQTAGIALSRLTGAAAIWARADTIQARLFTHWNDANAAADAGLREAIIRRFGNVYTMESAVEAIMDLKQKTDETVSAFHDRVRLGVDRKNYMVAAADRDDAFRATMVRDIKMFLLAGLKEELRTRVLGVPNAPDDLEELLTVLRKAEAEMSSKKLPVLQVNHEQQLQKHIPSGSVQGENAQLSETNDATSTTSETVNRVFTRGRGRFSAGAPRGRGRGSIQCYNCSKWGHVMAQCPTRPQNASQPRPFATRGGRGFRTNYFQTGYGPAARARQPDHAYPAWPQQPQTVNYIDSDPDWAYQMQAPADFDPSYTHGPSGNF